MISAAMDHAEKPEGITINSFVFIDLETSHLDKADHPKIIEMSLFAIHRTGLLHPVVLTSLNCAKREDATYDLSKVSFPRVIDKLTLCVDPQKQTSPQTFCLTKLDNLNLSESKKMSLDKDVISMLDIFLRRQEGPVCLVAHNGNKFDFPMLRTELSRVTADEHFEDFLCLDSLEFFKDYFSTEAEAKQEEQQILLKRKLPECEKSRLPVKKGTSAVLSDTTIGAQGSVVNASSDSAAAKATSTATFNETPGNYPAGLETASNGSSSSLIHPQASGDLGLSAHPCLLPKDPVLLHTDDTSTSSCTSTTEKNHSTCSDDIPDQKRPSPPPPPRKTNHRVSYSLINIFKRTFGREPSVSHSAEDDVESLIKVLLPRVEKFLDWADKHAGQYKNIDYYYKPKKLTYRRKLFDD